MLSVDLAVKLIGIIAILSVMAGIAFYSGAIETKSTNKALNHPFNSSLSNDKLIIVQGWDESDLNKILNDFEKVYENYGYPSYSISIEKENANKFTLRFTKDIHPLLFLYLINYLCYPFDFDLKSTISTAGETTLTRDFEGLNHTLMGQKVIFYTPTNDQAHDLIYMFTNRRAMLSFSFSTGEWKEITEPRFNSLAEKLKDSL